MIAKTLLLAFLIFPFASIAQKSPLMIKGEKPSFYLEHTVDVKENYYSIGRLYNVSPSQHIAPFNNQKLEDGLKIGQEIMIPLAATNFSQDGVSSSDEAMIPVYYSNNEGKTIYAISSLFNDVSLSLLRKWNNISTAAKKAPDRVIVGYLKVKKDLSAFSSSASKTIAVDNDEKKESNPKTIITPGQTDKREQKVNKVAEPDKSENQDVKAERPTEKNFNGGYFRSNFERQRGGRSGNEVTGTAGIFKSTSGWEDGKYYCLNNSAISGSVVKITNNANNRVVYAKVLDAMPDMKQNEGLILRLSNAAASELGVTGNTFDCTITY